MDEGKGEVLGEGSLWGVSLGYEVASHRKFEEEHSWQWEQPLQSPKAGMGLARGRLLAGGGECDRKSGAKSPKVA